MNVLLDTSVLLWWATESERIPQHVLALLAAEENVRFVSAATAWEISTKVRIGKLPSARGLVANYSNLMLQWEFRDLAISREHALAAGQLSGEHKDPFDRILAAQSISEGLPIVASDPAFQILGCAVIW